ncbi:MAG TPA: glycosyltransferase [Syntrophales bacterium]|nr:glycosyltransferase [Syntrophales bacterium]HOM07645.1 glycosyltransferase [Syntrophales bacterium]HOO00318.1 glycosyltransferase [Syntrophales bacterium]HPC01214.1 glycosyltransferase [Syntrophales bacterium]HPQ07213.1 glycosyltransferase [Syntrophales bacterium]
MISLVIPVYNEEKNLRPLMERITAAMAPLGRPYEVIFIDDGSRDSSLEILKDLASRPEVRVVELTRNYGQHAAILAGFSVCRGEIVVTLDADLQNPPEEIPRLVGVMEEGAYDVVGTIRKHRRDSLLRIVPSRIVNRIASRITGVAMSDWGCMLRAYRRPVVERMVACHEHATFIPALATVFGKRVTEIEVAHEERHGGVSSYPLGRLVNLQFDLVASFSDLPMKALMYGGVAMSFLGVCFGVFLAVARLVYGAVWAAQGVFTLFAVLFVFVGLQFFALGVIGEYIGRIYREVRRRPEFVIERIHGDGEGTGP